MKNCYLLDLQIAQKDVGSANIGYISGQQVDLTQSWGWSILLFL